MQIGPYQFRPEWKTSVFSLVLFPFLLSLGVWQLQREQEKLDILAVYQQRMSAPLESITDMWQTLRDPENAAFRRLSLRGELLDAPIYLLDNKIHQGTVGYQLVQALELSGTPAARRVWLNRGWLPAGRLRSELPMPETPRGQQTIVAHVYVPLGKPFVLANEALSVEGERPIIAQQLDMQEMISAFPDNDTFPHMLRLEAESPAALTIDWPPINTKPEKHRAYAVQWFAMALALLIFYVLRSVETRE